jgi:hypothetical protein
MELLRITEIRFYGFAIMGKRFFRWGVGFSIVQQSPKIFGMTFAFCPGFFRGAFELLGEEAGTKTIANGFGFFGAIAISLAMINLIRACPLYPCFRSNLR